MKLAHFGSKHVTRFAKNNGVLAWFIFQNCIHPPPHNPVTKIQNNLEPALIVCANQACRPCSLPSSALVTGSFSLGSSSVDVVIVRTHLGTENPRFPATDAPSSFFSAPQEEGT